MAIPYRTRRALKRLVTGLLVLALAAVVVWGCWVVWLERYVVYTEDGAILDFDLSLQFPPGEQAVAPPASTTVPIYFDDGSQTDSGALAQLNGYYVEPDLLLSDIDAVKRQLQELPIGTPVLIDVKNIRGGFYYTTGVEGAAQASTPDTDAMDALLDYLHSRNLYTIARLPSFRDYSYSLANPTYGLPAQKNGKNAGYLWMDEDRVYWLDPADDGTLGYLIQIAGELKSLGFDEVVFDGFSYPDTDAIYFNNTKTKDEVLADTAQRLVTAFASDADSFCISFVANADFKLPIGRTRLYLDGASAADAAELAAETGMDAPQINLVFLTEVNDTRFDAYSVLRPLSMAHFETEE